jgi:signal transduction histidine kinase
MSAGALKLRAAPSIPHKYGNGAARGARRRLVGNPEFAFMLLMSSLKFLFRVLLSTLLMSGVALAAEAGNSAEAEAMVKKAVAYIKANGNEKAYEEFTHGKSFKDRDLYIIVYDLEGKNLAQGGNPKLVGKELIGLKDPDGKPIIKMFIDLAKEKGKGWTEGYKFLNPVTQKIEGKAMYLERLGDVLVGCGIYKG